MSKISDKKKYHCALCSIESSEPFKQYCDPCTEHLSQAYQWLQSPMLSQSEMNLLKEKIMDLTDIQKVRFD